MSLGERGDIRIVGVDSLSRYLREVYYVGYTTLTSIQR